MVFQNYALYPQMNALITLLLVFKFKNLIQEIKKKVEAASVLNLTEYLMRTPKELSGGQRQSVAMGRALVRDPKFSYLMNPFQLRCKLEGS